MAKAVGVATMSPERWQEIKAVLSEVLASPATEQRTTLERACEGNPGLLEEVEPFLERCDELEGFIARPLWRPRADAADSGGRIGPYRLERLLGEGGMGSVYLAVREEDFTHRVALKLIRRRGSRRELVGRFHTERQILAQLEHPNIARLLDGGTTEDGLPYFVMEYVEGEPIDRYCDRRSLGLGSRLELFLQVCSALQAAHRNLVVHRDLKPSNVLVSPEGTAKLLDFGIAKLLDSDELLTVAGMAPMTPRYASPEQLSGGIITTSSDVYSLGVLLYRLLSGHPPYDMESGSYSDLVRAVCVDEPKRPSSMVLAGVTDDNPGGLTPEAVSRDRGTEPEKLRRRLAGDLDAIVMKALRKEPRHRYGSVEQLADDIRRHLRGLPVGARQGTWVYRAGKLVRRYKLASAMVLLVCASGVTSTVLWRKAIAQAERADREAQVAQQVSAFLTEQFKVLDPGEARGNTVTARELLDSAARRIVSELAGQPLLQARLMRTLGDVYANLGLYAEALPLEQQALDLRQAALGAEHPEFAASLTALGRLYNLQGRYGEAEPLLRRAIAVREGALGPEHPDVADSLTPLAKISYLLGRPEEAESLYRRALAIRETALEPDHPELATSLAHLGWLFGNQERYEEAEEMLSRALAIREAALGPEHFLVAETLDVMGELFSQQARLGEAEAVRHRALAIRQRVFEPDHPEIGQSLFSLGNLYYLQGRYDEAAETLRQGLELVESALGADHHMLGRGLWDLGQVLAYQGRWEESEAVFRRLSGIYEKTLGPSDEQLGRALNNLGWVLSDGLDRYREGEEVLRRAVALLPAGGYWDALARWSLANNLRDQGRYGEAEPLYRETLAILGRTGGSRRQDNPRLPELVADYAKMLHAAGKEGEARALEARVRD